MATLCSLGVGNLARVLAYRVSLKLGLNPAQRLRQAAPAGPFFSVGMVPPGLDLPANSAWWAYASYFGMARFPVSDAAPDWHANPLTGASAGHADTPWWKIPDFSSGAGDIKAVWEASRFDWVPVLMQHALKGEPKALPRLEAWLVDWCAKNPPYLGANWKCGQEASIRVIHLATALCMLGVKSEPSASLLDLVEVHLKRIAPTTGYAIAQDNNHGTSEAAALFIGGHLLSAFRPRSRGAYWHRKGRRLLENRVRRLVADDGSFSQYSLNYHRLMLDTLSIAEHWRRSNGLPAFSAEFGRRAEQAAEWLRVMVQPSGDAPNVGSNDGARLLPFSEADYRDFRPSVQLAAVLFTGKVAYPPGDWNLPLQWLGIPVPEQCADPMRSRILDDGGYACLRHGKAFVLVRYPRFRFRPSQADALHLDLWLDGLNVLRDAGTYSYNAGEQWLDYFSGTAAHNTVEFDGRDQMPRLGRFLFGSWLKCENPPKFSFMPDHDYFEASYRDFRGAHHRRSVWLRDNGLRVEDDVRGFSDKAVLRWRLAPGEWRLKDGVVENGHITLSVSASSGVESLRIVPGQESRYYMQMTELPVLEAVLAGSGRVTTEIGWAT